MLKRDSGICKSSNLFCLCRYFLNHINSSGDKCEGYWPSLSTTSCSITNLSLYTFSVRPQALSQHNDPGSHLQSLRVDKNMKPLCHPDKY